MRFGVLLLALGACSSHRETELILTPAPIVAPWLVCVPDGPRPCVQETPYPERKYRFTIVEPKKQRGK